MSLGMRLVACQPDWALTRSQQVLCDRLPSRAYHRAVAVNHATQASSAAQTEPNHTAPKAILLPPAHPTDPLQPADLHRVAPHRDQPQPDMAVWREGVNHVGLTEQQAKGTLFDVLV